MNPRDRFLDAATEPLADNAELQLAARHQLDASISPEAESTELEAGAERLGRGGSDRWRWIWAVVVGLLSLPMLLGPVRKLAEIWAMTQSWISPIGSMSVEPKHSFRETLSDKERLLLFGETSSSFSEADQWRPLWESEPENPVFFFEYVIAYERDHDALPPDFLETADRLDPGNGWALLKLALEDADAVVERDNMGWRARERGDPVTWTVKDEAELAKRIALLKEAASAGKIESYQGELRRKRMDVLPEAQDFTSHLQTMAYAAGMSLDMALQKLANLIGAEARRCEREKDRQGFVELAEAWEVLVRTSAEDSNSLVEALIAGVTIRSTLPAMADAAATVEVDAALWAERDKSFTERQELLKERSSDDIDELFSRHGSIMSSLSLPMIARQAVDYPVVTRDDLRPMTRVDQAFIARAMAVGGWVILGLFCGVSWLTAKLQNPLLKRMGTSLSRLLGPSDLLWIALGGVIGPLLVYLGLRYGTPLSRLDWGPSRTRYAVPAAHFVGLLLMLAVWPVAIARWRASKIGLLWKSPGWWTWSAVATPLAGMFCFSFAVPPSGHSIFLGGLGMVCGAWSLVWLLAQGWMAVFSRIECRLPRRALPFTTRSAWLAGMLAMVALVFHFHAEERRWFARDELMQITPGFTAYENAVTEQVKRELLELLE